MTDSAEASSLTTPRRGRARRGEGEKLRDEILEAAEKLLVATGDESAVSIRAIADAVGVTPPAIYMHFHDKDALMFELCEARFETFRDVMNEALNSSDDPVECIQVAGRAYLDFAFEHPEHYSVLFMSKVPMPADRQFEDLAGSQAFMSLVAAVQRCIDTGRFRNVDPVASAIGLWTGLHGYVSLVIRATDFPWPERAPLEDHLLDALLRSLLVETPR